MTNLRNIIDTWNMIEEYGISYKQENGVVKIQDADFDRLLETVKNKQYILNLKVK